MSSLKSFDEEDPFADDASVGRSGGRRRTHPHMDSLDNLDDLLDSNVEKEEEEGEDGRKTVEEDGRSLSVSSSPPQKKLKQTRTPWYLRPPQSHEECKLIIVQITDVYTLDNFASLKTFLNHLRAAHKDHSNVKVVSMLTGDFLSPYLLSSIDRGFGMMAALAATPIDILTWGNHETDIDHHVVCKHVKDWYPRIWINSNMQSHEAMRFQVPYHVIELSSANGKTTRRVGLVAVLSNDTKLYAHFEKTGGAFGGATIDDPWETLRKYHALLTKPPHNCDLVIPLEHLYIPENKKTCEQFDCFPLILSGHDHHRVDQIINGTRLIKPGMDGVHAAVVEISWNDSSGTVTFSNEQQRPQQPRIRNTFVELAASSDYPPDPELKEQTDAAYNVLAPLRNTELAMILPQYRPLSSKNARGEVCTVGRLICGMIKASLEQTRTRRLRRRLNAATATTEAVDNAQTTSSTSLSVSDDGLMSRRPVDDEEEEEVDAVILMGGNIRGGEDYPDDSFFSLEMLEAEIKPDEVVGVVQMPGYVLKAGIEVTHSGGPKPGWMQFDDGIQLDVTTKQVVTVACEPIDLNRSYRVATKISDLTNGQSPPLKEYFVQNHELLPAKGDYINIQMELMGFFARNLFRKLWKASGKHLSSEDLEQLAQAAETAKASAETKVEALVATAPAELEGELRLGVLDRDNDGIVSVEDIHMALRDYLGLSVDENEMTLAKYIHDYADVTGNGVVTVDDFEIFCNSRQGLPEEFQPLKSRKWTKAFPDPVEHKDLPLTQQQQK